MKKTLDYFLSVIVLFICISATSVMYALAQTDIAQKESLLFNQIAEQVVSVVKERMDIYISAHYGGVGLFASSEYVSGDEWRRYVRSTRLLEHYPGINGLGYTAQVGYEQLPAFMEDVRSRENREFDYHPKGVRENYFIIKYIEPIEDNFQAYGFDMGSEARRRRAMEDARDTGLPVISRKVLLVQDKDRGPGFLTYVPVYEEGASPGSVAERRKMFKGLVYAPYIAGKFFGSIWNFDSEHFNKLVNLEIYDGLQLNEETLFFKAGPEENPHHPHGRHEFVFPVYLYGTVWSLKLKTSGAFHAAIDHTQPWLILTSGISLSFMIALLVYSLTRVKRRAEDLAADMTRESRAYQQSLEAYNLELQRAKKDLEEKIKLRTEELEDSRGSLEKQVETRTVELNKKIDEFSRMNKMMLGREKRMVELKKEVAKLKEEIERMSRS